MALGHCQQFAHFSHKFLGVASTHADAGDYFYLVGVYYFLTDIERHAVFIGVHKNIVGIQNRCRVRVDIK